MREPIETERLILRRPQLADAVELAQWINDYDVAKQTATISHPYTHLHAEFWIMICPSFWKRGLAYNYVIQHGGDVIGSIGLFRGSTTAEFEIGYMLSADHWGQGLMSEAVKALLMTAKEYLGISRCHAGVFADNPGSAALLLKLGFDRTGPNSLFSMARGAVVHGHSYIYHMAALETPSQTVSAGVRGEHEVS